MIKQRDAEIDKLQRQLELQPSSGEKQRGIMTGSAMLRCYARLWALHRLVYFNQNQPGFLGFHVGDSLGANLKFLFPVVFVRTLVTGEGLALAALLHFTMVFAPTLPYAYPI